MPRAILDRTFSYLLNEAEEKDVSYVQIEHYDNHFNVVFVTRSEKHTRWKTYRIKVLQLILDKPVLMQFWNCYEKNIIYIHKGKNIYYERKQGTFRDNKRKQLTSSNKRKT